jgi:excisionase family DNA binding protein
MVFHFNRNASTNIIERGTNMADRKRSEKVAELFPMLKTVEQMSKISGLGENKLRELMDNGEIEYVQNGNRRLLADSAIWDWYERHKIAPVGCSAREA